MSDVLCDGEIIEVRHLPALMRGGLKAESGDSGEPATIRQMEIVLIKQALRRNKGNKTVSARQLGIDKSTLFRKIKAFNVNIGKYSR